MMASDASRSRMLPLMMGKKLKSPCTRVESEFALPTS